MYASVIMHPSTLSVSPMLPPLSAVSPYTHDLPLLRSSSPCQHATSESPTPTPTPGLNICTFAQAAGRFALLHFNLWSTEPPSLSLRLSCVDSGLIHSLPTG